MNRQVFRYHPKIGHTYIPGLKSRVEHEGGGYLIKVNQAGFRSNREFENEKSPGIFRILLFGDSFTAGDGVSNRKRYSDILETLIPGLEVYNFGLSGTGTDQQYLIYHEMASPFEHDLVLISITVENIRRIAARYRVYLSYNGKQQIFAKPYFTLEPDGTLQIHHMPVPKDPVTEENLLPRERRYVDKGGRYNWLYHKLKKIDERLIDIAQRISGYQLLPAYNSKRNPDWLLMRAIITKWLSEAKKPLLLCPIPVHQYIEETANPNAYLARFKELAEETNARLHDLLIDFWKKPKMERRQFRFLKNSHPSSTGHQLIAESLAPTIELYMKQRRTRCQ